MATDVGCTTRALPVLALDLKTMSSLVPCSLSLLDLDPRGLCSRDHGAGRGGWCWGSRDRGKPLASGSSHYDISDVDTVFLPGRFVEVPLPQNPSASLLP